jgi:Ca2+:H+ antiporter
MSENIDHLTKLPRWSWVGPITSALYLLLQSMPGLATDGLAWSLAATVLLGISVFAAVHHAEILALRVGEPFGSVLLAIAVTIIEVALIISILLSNAPNSEFVARDTVYSAVLIVLNGVIGLSLILGGQRHHEQSFRSDGIAAALAVLGTLVTISLIFPNFTHAVEGPFYSYSQLLFVGLVSIILYGIFIFVQTVRHRDYFIDLMTCNGEQETIHEKPSWKITLLSSILLLISLVAVILIAKTLSPPLNAAITWAGLPSGFLGVVIAMVVLLPESIAAIRAALSNRLQNSLNLAIGSAIASIGLTIPSVAILSIVLHKPLALGLSPQDSVLLALTLFISTLTLGAGRTTVLHGAVHLVIFGIFIFMAAVP